MIILQKKEKISVYQVAMELQVEMDKHPFISILMLAGELYNEDKAITATDLRLKLFPPLPERACLNLLKRLEADDYLCPAKGSKPTNRFNDTLNSEYYFDLTSKGKQSIESRSVWIGEKGIYNIYIADNPLAIQRIVAIRRVTPNEIQNSSHLENWKSSKTIQDLEKTYVDIKGIDNKGNTYNNERYYIAKMDDKCFELQAEDCDLEIAAKPNVPIQLHLTFKKNQYQTMVFNHTYDTLKEALLTHQFGKAYQKPYILTNYNAEQLNFTRDIDIEHFKWDDNVFENTHLKDVPCRPSNSKEAQFWYEAILTNQVTKYYMDSDFEILSENCQKEFKPYFILPIMSRQNLAEKISSEKKNFYLKAKLETIDFLTY
jgi:hypothetical protein